jgi:ankyrin repeat protein
MKTRGGPEWSRQLRTTASTIDPVSAQLAPTPYLPRVFGVVMDMPVKGSWASVVVIADVTTSMYFGTGVGFVRMEAWQSVADTSRELLLVAERHLDAFEPSTSLDLPADGHRRISILTHGGRLVADALETELRDWNHPVAPVHWAVHRVITTIRLCQGGQPPARLPRGATGVMRAAYLGDVGALLKWFGFGMNLEVRDDDGYTALMYGANAGREDSVRVLLAYGADPNATDNRRSTPLMFAAQHGYDSIVSQLLAAGASPNACGDHGLTPLGFARQNNHASTASLLLGAGAIDADANCSE